MWPLVYQLRPQESFHDAYLQESNSRTFSVAILSIPSHATSVVVTVENLQPSDGFFFTPVWTGFHDGGFDLLDAGSTGSNPLETIAKTGDASPLSDLFNDTINHDGTPRVDTVVFATDGFGETPVFDPGEKVSTTICVSDPSSNRYLSFISMVIPSNDAFFPTTPSLTPQARWHTKCSTSPADSLHH